MFMQLIRKILFFILILLFSTISVNAKNKFLSLRNNKVNVRYGPSFESDIKYIYKKKNLPVRIIDKQENFRRIIDVKKNSGWIHISQLKNSNSFILLTDKILFKKATLFSQPILKLQKGRLLLIKRCEKNWCKIKTEDYSGWVRNSDVWGYF